MRYDWTDWITHVPGQELPAGMYGMFEFHGLRRNCGIPYITEGVITPQMRGHKTWHATSPGERGHAMLLRYKLRVVCETATAIVSRETETV